MEAQLQVQLLKAPISVHLNGLVRLFVWFPVGTNGNINCTFLLPISWVAPPGDNWDGP